jgi:threonylcarbamoyladenosine tRNA methylthiotransferase MtaB
MQTTPPRRAALHTLGCRLNQAETAAIRRSLEAEGYRIVPWGEEAELCVLNSCTVTAQSDAKARQALRALRRRYPHAKLALVGCYAQTQGDLLAEQGLADLILGNRDKMDVAGFLPRLEGAGGPLVSRPRIPRAPFRLKTFASLDGRTRAALKVQDGCDFMCTFCIIPTARGRARPRALDNLLDEARALAAAGAREVVLTGVNVGTFAGDEGGLVEVVDHLDALPGLARIRISSIEPTTVEPGLLERMADPAHRLVPYLHLPLQSGCDRVLAAMRRRYTAAGFCAFAEDALARVPGLCLGTDVLVGFPGEDDAAFEETRALLETLPFAYFHVFPYSERTGTPAVRLPDKVKAGTRQRRVAVLNALSAAKRKAFHARHEGATRTVLFEQAKTPGLARGLSENYIRVEVPTSDPAALRNRLLPVRLGASQGAAMAGELLREAG